MKNVIIKWAVLAASTSGLSIAGSMENEKYVYDASGNMVEKSIGGRVMRMSYDQSNRIVGKTNPDQPEVAVSYDRSGRPVAETSAEGDPVRALSYGYEDKVLEVDAGGRKSRFFYNAAGQIVGKKSQDRVTTYSWDGDALSAEGGDAFVNEDHVSGAVPILAMREEAVVSDYLGSTLSSGNLRFESTAYGDGLENGRYTGKVFVKDLASFVFPFRLFSPEVARWNVSDPSGFPDGTNNHLYVSGDPLSKLDPSGLVEYTWAPDEPYTGTGQFIPVTVTVKDPGTIKVKTVTTADNKTCYQPVVDKAFKAKSGGVLKIPLQAFINGGYLYDSTFVATTRQHETWHKTHWQTVTDKTIETYEKWQNVYQGNYFGSYSDALAAGNEDTETAFAEAQTMWQSNKDKSADHEGGNPAPIAEPRIENGNHVWRSVNPDWGQTLDNTLKKLNLTFDKKSGNCES